MFKNLTAEEDKERAALASFGVAVGRALLVGAGPGRSLGPVDGFDQDEGSGECDEGAEVCGGLFAAQGDAFEAFDLNDMTDEGLN